MAASSMYFLIIPFKEKTRKLLNDLITLKFLLYILVLLYVLFEFSLIHTVQCRVSVRGVKSLGGHFVYLCRGFHFYEVK